MQKKNQTDPKRPQQNLNDYAKYSAIAFQMGAIILVFVFGGLKIDKWLKWDFPVFTVVLAIFGVGLSIYLAVKDFLKME